MTPSIQRAARSIDPLVRILVRRDDSEQWENGDFARFCGARSARRAPPARRGLQTEVEQDDARRHPESDVDQERLVLEENLRGAASLPFHVEDVEIPEDAVEDEGDRHAQVLRLEL